ncbi:hypothetical protein C8Q79DRAFT_418006 [Trametes meyenii]|nr:hypothetical protein C8Q79DRAFT_418006 [Trametes meyenii]
MSETRLDQWQCSPVLTSMTEPNSAIFDYECFRLRRPSSFLWARRFCSIAPGEQNTIILSKRARTKRRDMRSTSSAKAFIAPYRRTASPTPSQRPPKRRSPARRKQPRRPMAYPRGPTMRDAQPNEKRYRKRTGPSPWAPSLEALGKAWAARSGLGPHCCCARVRPQTPCCTRELFSHDSSVVCCLAMGLPNRRSGGANHSCNASVGLPRDLS